MLSTLITLNLRKNPGENQKGNKDHPERLPRAGVIADWNFQEACVELLPDERYPIRKVIKARQRIQL